MTSYSFDWVDAFTDTAFGGNGCVVVHDAGDVSLDARMRLVRETSLSECAYMVPSDKADFGVRYYLAEREILMAGHPTIATVTSMLSRGMVGAGSFTLEVGAGVLPIEVDGDGLITMTQAQPVFGDTHDPADIASIYGLSAEEIVGTPQTVSTGTPFCITVLRDHDALRRAVMDVDLLERFRANDSHPLSGLMEPFLVTLQGATAGGDTFSRLLLAPPMPAEDPFTGSATGCMAAYLWRHGLIDSPSFVAEQGHDMGRPGAARVDVLGPRDSITGVKVAGTGVVLMSGQMSL
ncbi:MAG: PhzF family phenazine biosynthesis protein [Pseudomonadota bacterium]